MEGATGRELCPGERTVVVRMMCCGSCEVKPGFPQLQYERVPEAL